MGSPGGKAPEKPGRIGGGLHLTERELAVEAFGVSCDIPRLNIMMVRSKSSGFERSAGSRPVRNR